jgi:outer membrane immunogenic protein
MRHGTGTKIKMGDKRGGVMLRQFLGVVGIACALIAAPLSAACAADMPSYKGPALLPPPPPPPPPAYSWTGCYIDAGAGYGFWNQDNRLTGTAFGGPPGGPLVPVGTTSTLTTTNGGRGWLGRFGGGCDYQTPLFNNRFVVGVFGDYDVMSLLGSDSIGEACTICGAGTPPIMASEKETGAWYVGGRIGYLVNPAFLAFVDGGYTQTRFAQSEEFFIGSGAGVPVGYPNFTDQGWFIGGGGEYALDWFPIRGFFVKGEYRYAQYSTANLTETQANGAGPTGNIETTKPYVQTVTGSLVWRFNWTGH